jgi:hypothetical protein
LAHYVEDSYQPHHSTLDFNSVSYLIGRIKQLPATTQPSAALVAGLRLASSINPHGDLEYQLFENTHPPRDRLRAEFWADLLADIDELAANPATQPNSAQPTSTQLISAQSFDPFRWDLHILSDSYDYLPLVGHAAQAAYASGSFDAGAFFDFEGVVHGRRMTIIQLKALQNAKAVLAVEKCYRLAWAAGHGRS